MMRKVFGPKREEVGENRIM